MDGTKARHLQNGREREREELGRLGQKARADPKLLSLSDLDSICTLAAKLCPPTAPYNNKSASPPPEPFYPFVPEPHTREDLQVLQRLAHAVEFLATRVDELMAAEDGPAVDRQRIPERRLRGRRTN